MKKTALILITIFLGISCNYKQKVNKELIEIGVIAPLTGASANHGKDLVEGINLAFQTRYDYIDTLKYRINIIIEDDLSTPQGGVNALENLLQSHKPVIIIGPVASSTMLAMIPIAEKNKTPLFSPAASSPKISNSGQYIFRMALLAPDQTKQLSNYAFNNGIKRIGILYSNDDTGISYMESFVTDFAALGGEIVLKEAYDKKSTDFKTQLIKIKNSISEAVFIPGVPQTIGIILRQAKELDLNLKFFGNYGSEGEDLLTASQGAAEGFVYASVPLTEKFIKEFYKTSNKPPTIGPALGYDALHISLEIINRYGPDRESVRKGLTELHDFVGATGKTTILPSHDASKEVVLKTIKNNSFIRLTDEL
jgi:branched-chain amino acid transport system substrate-binding protein